MPQLRGFAQWLPKHAGLVNSIRAQMPLQVSHTAKTDFNTIAEMLHQAVQEAAAAAAAPAEVPTALRTPGEVANCLGQQLQHLQLPEQQQCWRLASFSCNLPGAAGMLAALPAHSLTHLDLGVSNSCDTTSEELAAALARLSSLQRLCIVSDFVCTERIWLPSSQIQGIDGSYLRNGVGQLTQLTSLSLKGFFEDEEPVEQLLTQPLPRLQQLLLLLLRPLTKMNLAHLTQLQEMGSGGGFPLTDTATLPTQLKRLHLYTNHGGHMLAAVRPLQQLQQLRLQVKFSEPQPLLQLAQLPALQHLALLHFHPRQAASAAAAWPLLPQLQQLVIGSGDRYHPPTRQEMASLLAALAGATSLTMLQLECCAADYAGGEPHLDDSNARPALLNTAVCASLAGLTRLKELHIEEVQMVPGDALALTALTGLTSLKVDRGQAGFGTAAATALAGSLKQLRHLQLDECEVNLGSCAFLAALGQLVQLTQLQLQYNCGGITQQGLMQLTGLSRLQQLRVSSWHEGVTDEVLRAFWAAIQRQLQQA
jgi:hypothetical protein